MRKFVSAALLVGMGFAAGGVTGAVALRYLRDRRPSAASFAPAALVNGEPVSMEEFLFDLKVLYGDHALERTIQQRLVFQECARRKILPDETALAAFGAKLDKDLDPRVRVAAERELRYRDLVGKLLLDGVAEAEKKQVYDLFRSELTQYELLGILALTSRDAQDIADTLHYKADFAALAGSRSMDPGSRQNGGRIGSLTMPQINSVFGPAAASTIRAMKPDDVSAPVYCRQGHMVFKLVKVKSNYSDLKPAVEALIARSKQLDLTYRLLSKADIKSLYLQGASPKLPAQQEAPGAPLPVITPLP